MRHLLGADDAVRAQESPPELRPAEVTWREEAPRGKLDLLTAIDFRMTSTCTYADVVLPAATWYEKHDISTTDMHPFVHSFNPAIAPPWETRTDFDAFTLIAARVLPAGRRRTWARAPTWSPRRCMHDTPDELAQPGGAVRGLEGRASASPVPGRDHAAAGHRRAGLPGDRGEDGRARPADRDAWAPRSRASPGCRRRRSTTCAARTGRCAAGSRDGRPSLAAGRAHGRGDPGAVRHHQRRRSPSQAWRGAGEAHRACSWPTWPPSGPGSASRSPTPQVQPRAVITSPEWSGSETGGRRYSPFTVNVERKKPWHTLTGRMHFFLDHDWMHELRRGAAGLPAAAGLPPAFRRAGPGRGRPARDHRPVPDPALEVVDPLRVPGQPAHAAAVPRRPGDLDEPGRRGGDRRGRQRLDRGVQPQRRGRLPGRGHATGCRRARCSCTTPRTGT